MCHMRKPTHNNYYEAIIQLRPFKQEVLQFIVAEVGKRKDVFLTRTEELKTGVDFFLSSQRFARALGKKLNDRFDGKLTISKKINKLDRQTGVVLYRATVLFRLKQ